MSVLMHRRGVIASAAAPPPPGGLSYPFLEDAVAFYELDDTSDAHTNGHDLTNNNGVTFSTGKVGNAASFAAASSQHLSVSGVDLSGTALTVSAWVRLTSKGAFRGIVAQYETTGNQRAFNLIYRSDEDRFAVGASSDGVGATFVSANAFGSPSTGVWYLVDAIVTDRVVMIRVNGGAWNAATHSGGIFASSAPLNIGRRVSNYMDGQIDSVFIAKRVLTEGDLDFLHNGGNGRSYADLAVEQRSLGDVIFVDDIVKDAANPVLTKGSSGAWDDLGIRDPILLTNPDGTVAQESGSYVVYFNGRKVSNGNTAVGRSTGVSLDSLTKYASNPVLTDGTYSSVGSVIKNGVSDYRMYYGAGTSVGFKIATSADGLSFAAGASLILEPSDFVNCDFMGLPFVVKIGSTWYMVFEGFDTGGPFHIFMATSSDGLTWTPANSGAAIYSGEQGWDSTDQANPSLYVLDTGKYLILYNGHRGNGDWEVGALYSTTLTTWERFNHVPPLRLGATGQWDDARLEGLRIVADQISGGGPIDGLYFGLPTSDSFADGAIGLVTLNQP